jgi:hypothetical protein
MNTAVLNRLPAAQSGHHSKRRERPTHGDVRATAECTPLVARHWHMTHRCLRIKVGRTEGVAEQEKRANPDLQEGPLREARAAEF